MATYQVNLVGGQIVCPRIRGRKNDDIQWECQQNHHFTVSFGWETPLEFQNIAVEEVVGTPNPDPTINSFITPANVTVNADADKKGGPVRFKYTIALWDGNRIFVEDPEIIIDP